MGVFRADWTEHEVRPVKERDRDSLIVWYFEKKERENALRKQKGESGSADEASKQYLSSKELTSSVDERKAADLVEDVMRGELSVKEIVKKHIGGGRKNGGGRKSLKHLQLASDIFGMPRLADPSVWEEEIDDEFLKQLRSGIDTMGRG